MYEILRCVCNHIVLAHTRRRVLRAHLTQLNHVGNSGISNLLFGRVDTLQSFPGKHGCTEDAPSDTIYTRLGLLALKPQSCRPRVWNEQGGQVTFLLLSLGEASF